MTERYRTAVVTGGGRGIGAAVARALCARGLAVTVFARSERQLEEVVRAGAAALAVAGDAGDGDPRHRDDSVR